MNPRRRLWCWSLGILILVALFAAGLQPGVARALEGDVLLGARGSNDDPIDPGSVTSVNFGDYFTYNGTDTSSLTIGGSTGGSMIGAIWTGGSDGDWAQMRVVIDSNGDDTYDPFDWEDPGHPWNMTTGTWDYPAGYPGTPDDGGNNDGTIDFDGGESFPWDTFQWWWYEADYDKTEIWWIERGQLMNTYWEGRDQEWNVLPNGDYKVLVQVLDDLGNLIDNTQKIMVIDIQTANITGTVHDSQGAPIAGAEVEAGSYLAWGQARTGTDGSFTVSGLEADASYHLRVQAADKVSAEQEVAIPAGQTTVDAGIITMSDAVSITGTITLPAPFTAFTNQWGWEQNELWVWLDAWNTQGPGWGNGQVRFLDADHPEFTPGADTSLPFVINIPPPASSATYQLNVHVEGYAATPVDVSVDSDGGTVADPIVLTKASILIGSVLLPNPVSEWKNIDVQAINVDNTDDRYWGWGQIEASEQAPTATGQFRIDGVPAGTFDLEVRVWGYVLATLEDVVIVQDQDKDVGQIAILEGSKITGTLTIQGDTTDLERWEGDTEDPLFIWIDAWSPSAGWGGTNVEVARGNNQSVGYTIGGLSDGTFEIHSWLGEEYELVDQDGNAPVLVTVAGTAAQDITLKPYEGIVTGTIDGSAVVGFDLTKVVVEAKRPWDWLPPKYAMFGDGIDAGGTFSVSGLGTGDYVVKAGMYEGYMDWDGNVDPDLANYEGDGILIPSEQVGVVMQRVFVENDASNPTTANVTFQQGYKISGTISLSAADPPWHDVNENGVKDADPDPQLSEDVSIVADVVGEPVMAMPMDMMFMGGEDPRMGAVNPDGTFDIVGLAPGVYFVMPPFNSERLSGAGGPQGDFFEGEQETHHWTATPQMVVITDSDVTAIDFTLGNGYTLSGRLTLPDAQTVAPGEEFWWVGHLELETPQSGYMGHGRPVFKGDFDGTNRYDFTFNHVANGDYLVRFWTDRYVPGGAKVTVNNANASVNLTIEEGANLVGKLVDADTGEAITGADGVRVICEAYPWVEGSWRETRDDMWSQSYIEDGSDPQNEERPNRTPGKFHLTALPTGHKYVIYVETYCGGDKTGGAKNYVGAVIAGIDIPEGATGDIDVGTIKLKEGITITGRLTDAESNPIPGVEVFAFPSDPHDGDIEGEGVSDTNGYYTVYGIDPEIEYWDMIVAERPDMFDDWGKQIEWGEKRKYNVAPGSIDVDFVLGRATASLSGTVTIPAGADFMLPFMDEEEFPATYIVMQRKGVVYDDVLDGIEAMTAPQPSDATESTYLIENIEPGVYKIFFMNYGLPTQVFDNVEIVDGNNTLDVTWTSTGYTVSGSVTLSTGGYPSSSDISGVVCMNTGDQTLIFGQLTEEADGTYSAYEVPGLLNGQTYQLAFYKDSGLDDMPDIFPVGDPLTINGADIADNTATITRNAEPFLMVQAVQDPDDDTVFHIGIFSTSYLVDASISVVGVLPTTDSTAGEIYIQTGSGSLSDVTLSGDKRNISATYTTDPSDTTVELVLAVHYGSDATTKVETLSFNVNSVASNGDVVNTYTAGQVKLGNGDGSQIYIPAGSLNAEGKVSVNIEKSTVEPVVEGFLLSSSVPGLGAFAASTATPLPSGVTAAGDQYDITAIDVETGEAPTVQGAVTVQIQYDPARVSDTDDLNVFHYTGGTWTLENTNRTLDTENNTISVEVTSLSPFIVGEGTPEGGTIPTGSSSGGGCFVSTAISGSN